MDDELSVTPDDLPRAFVDSSIVMAASLSETGKAYDLFEAGRDGRILLLASLYVLGETERNLYRKAPRGLRAFWELRDQLERVDPSPEKVSQVARDIEPKDAPIVAAASVARANYLVTFDRRHLLSQAEQIWHAYRIETVEPAVLLARLAGRGVDQQH